jgi:hypothetical protein
MVVVVVAFRPQAQVMQDDKKKGEPEGKGEGEGTCQWGETSLCFVAGVVPIQSEFGQQRQKRGNFSKWMRWPCQCPSQAAPSI